MNALEAFRRERGLLAGDDLDAWLAAAGLTEQEWSLRVLTGDTHGLPGALPAAGPQPAAAPVALPHPPPHEWVLFPRTCGDAALRLVCRVLAAPAAARLPEEATLAEIVDGAAAAGLCATALKVSRRRLAELPVPWIAHVDGGHWVVVHGAAEDEVVVSDPARGAGKLERGAFEARWSGWCAVFAPVVQSD